MALGNSVSLQGFHEICGEARAAARMDSWRMIVGWKRTMLDDKVAIYSKRKKRQNR
jgi:hypothetical protein